MDISLRCVINRVQTRQSCQCGVRVARSPEAETALRQFVLAHRLDDDKGGGGDTVGIGGISQADAAYLAELKAHHPDRHQDDEAARERATEESARMNEAWDVLERYYDAQPNSTT